MINDREQWSAALIHKLVQIIERPDMADRINPETNLAHVGLLSIGLVKLIVYLEQTFDITFEDDEMTEENFLTISRITENVMRKINVREGR